MRSAPVIFLGKQQPPFELMRVNINRFWNWRTNCLIHILVQSISDKNLPPKQQHRQHYAAPWVHTLIRICKYIFDILHHSTSVGIRMYTFFLKEKDVSVDKEDRSDADRSVVNRGQRQPMMTSEWLSCSPASADFAWALRVTRRTPGRKVRRGLEQPVGA